jgi:NAD(P)-dependent dehydrogenase (short-subunit alcohol dehydrogenase family)
VGALSVAELAQRVALVTGASRGIGAAIAERFAAEGAAVAVCARTEEAHPRLPGSLRETVARIEARGGRARAFRVDLTEPADRARVAEEVAAALGPVDVLVNNAAASFYRPFEDWTEKRWHVAFEVNVRAPFDLAQRLVPGMRARGGGAVLNISSATARHPEGPPYDEFARRGGDLLYGMTKAALDRMSTGLAAELHEAGVVVNSLSPVAAVRTPGVEALGVVPEAFLAEAEPVEWMAEAALALCVPGAPSGRVAFSGPLLEELGRAPRTLDGTRPLG